MPLVKKALENIYKKNDGKKINKDLFEASFKNLSEAVTQGFGVPDKLSINLKLQTLFFYTSFKICYLFFRS
jgi:hypothetical protein